MASSDNFDVNIFRNVHYAEALQNVKELVKDFGLQTNSSLTSTENSVTVEEVVKQLIRDALQEKNYSMQDIHEQQKKQQSKALDKAALPETVRTLSAQIWNETLEAKFQDSLNSLKASYPVAEPNKESIDSQLNSPSLDGLAKAAATRLASAYPDATK